MVSRAAREAVGGLVIQTTWVELLAAQLVVLAGDNTDDEWDLLEPRQELFARARKSAKKMQDPGIQQQTVNWLDQAQKLRGERNKVVHSVVHYDGRPGWSGFDLSQARPGADGHPRDCRACRAGP